MDLDSFVVGFLAGMLFFLLLWMVWVAYTD
jgi:hypothetical protein